MKTVLFSALFSALLHLAAPQPHRPRHDHLKRHAPVKVYTQVDYVTISAEDVIVYVDSQGKPVSTQTVYHNQSPSTSSPASPPSTSPATPPSTSPVSNPLPPPANPQPQPQQPQPQPQQPQPQQPQPQQPQPGPGPAPGPSQPNSPTTVSTGPGFKAGVSYTPYNADNSCKSTQQVATDLAKINGYEVIRLYGTDCNQVSNVLAATKGQNVKLFLGIFDLAQVQKEAETISNAVQGDWSRVNAVNVGNEMVNKGTDPGTVIGAIGQARGVLKGHGYNGPIVTVDTMVAMTNHPEICKASDFCAINCHAFFDGKTPAAKSGDFIKGWVDKIGKATGKTVVVTETGWPTRGDTNGVAVPSQENHQAAMKSIQDTFSNNVIFYSAYNDMWKKNGQGTFNAEQYWGIMGNAPSS
ncbi:MAG: hypothetical protein Q9168_000231 [Polycauliona sp. 1 TL-2023]